MKRFVVLALVATALCGCATLSPSDQRVLASHQVSAVVHEKMQHGEFLALADIAELSRRGLPPDFIVRYVRSTHKIYQLTTDDVLALRKSGVDKGVIDYLLATPQLFGRAFDRGWDYPYDSYYGVGYPSVVIVGRHHHHHRRHRR